MVYGSPPPTLAPGRRGDVIEYLVESESDESKQGDGSKQDDESKQGDESKQDDESK